MPHGRAGLIHSGQILAATWLALLLCTSLAKPVHAEEKTDKATETSDPSSLLELNLKELLDIQLEEKSSSKHAQPIQWSASAVSVYNGKEIRASGATTLVDFLRRVPGLDVYQFHSRDSFVSIRTQVSSDPTTRLLVLVDGQEAMMELAGAPRWVNPQIDLEDIESLEVIRGPGSTLYGANAYNGVINITTVSDWSTSADVGIRHGTEGYWSLYGRLRTSTKLGTGRLFFLASLGSDKIDSATDPDYSYKTPLRLNGILRYKRSDWLDLSLYGSLVKYQGTLWMAFCEWRAPNLDSYNLMAKANIKLSRRIKLQTQLSQFRYSSFLGARYVPVAYGLVLGQPPWFFGYSDHYNGEVQIDVQILQKLLLIAGGTARYGKGGCSECVNPTFDEIRGGAFVHLEWQPLAFLQLVGGFRADFDSLTERALSPRVVAIYSPWEGHSIRLGFSIAFRKPFTMEQSMFPSLQSVNPVLDRIYGPGRLEEAFKKSLANPNLNNETVQSLEVGWRSHLLDNRLQIGLSLFFNRYLDIITFDRKPFSLTQLPEYFFRYENLTTVLAVGGELEASFRPWRNWHIWANSIQRYIWDEKTGDRIAFDPIFRFNAGGGYDPDSGPLLDLAFHYVTHYLSQHSVNFADLSKPAVEMDLGNMLLFIGRLGYRFSLHDPKASLELGLIAKLPLGRAFREMVYIPYDPNLAASDDKSIADFGSDKVIHFVGLYLRGKI